MESLFTNEDIFTLGFCALLEFGVRGVGGEDEIDELIRANV